MDKTAKCGTCEYKGYSVEICKNHLNRMLTEQQEDCPHYRLSLKGLGKDVALGAGVGAAATVAGAAAISGAAIKAFLGHLALVKIGVGGGAAGAGFNVFRNAKKSADVPEGGKKRKHFRFPMVLNEKN